jgi:hypothetical protein
MSPTPWRGKREGWSALRIVPVQQACYDTRLTLGQPLTYVASSS